MTQSPLEHGWEAVVRYRPFCLTFTLGVTPLDLVERYGADPTTARLLAVGEACAVIQPADRSLLASGLLGDWAFGLETMGVEGSMPGTLAALSRGTQTVALNDSAKAMYVLKHWVDGQPRESFELGNHVTQRAAGAHPFWDAVERHGAAHPDQSQVIAALRAIGDHIGGQLTADMLARPLLTARLPEDGRPRSAPAADLPLVHPGEPVPLGRFLGTLGPLKPPPSTTLHDRAVVSPPGLSGIGHKKVGSNESAEPD
jgi:hypothetical protein